MTITRRRKHREVTFFELLLDSGSLDITLDHLSHDKYLLKPDSLRPVLSTQRLFNFRASILASG